MNILQKSLAVTGLIVAVVPVGWSAVHRADKAGATAPASQTAATAEAPVAMTVTVAEVRQAPVAAPVMAAGTVVPWEEVPVAAEAGGLILREVLVDEGDTVAAGQLLARLDDTLLQAQLAQQRAAIAEAEATLQSARDELARGQELVAKGTIAKSVAEERQTAARTAEARLGVAKAALSEFEARLAQTEIRAPVTGYISARSAVMGQVAQAGSELFRIVRDGRLEVDAQVPEEALPGVAAGQPARVTDAAGRSIEATVRDIAPTVDPHTRLGIVHVALPAHSGLRPGMFARVELQTEPRIALTVPQQAVVWSQGRPLVFEIGSDGTAVAREVETGLRRDGMVELLRGVTPGARVAVAGAGFLSDGVRVRVDTQLAGDEAGTEVAE